MARRQALTQSSPKGLGSNALVRLVLALRAGCGQPAINSSIVSIGSSEQRTSPFS